MNTAIQVKNKFSFKELLFQNNNLKKHEHSPKIDLWEEKDEDEYKSYIIRMEIPGVNRNKINIEIIDKNIVLVTNFKFYNNNNKIIYSECKYGKITRRIKLPSLVDDNQDIKYKYEDGILTIKIAIYNETLDIVNTNDTNDNIKQYICTKEGSGQGKYGYRLDPTDKVNKTKKYTGDWADDI